MVCLGFEPGPQDGRRRQNHGAMAATPAPTPAPTNFWQHLFSPALLMQLASFFVEPELLLLTKRGWSDRLAFRIQPKSST